MDTDMAAALVGDGGVLSSEALPELEGFGAKCVAGVLETITKEKVKVKQTPKPKDDNKDPPLPQEPKGVLEQATDFSHRLLKISTEAYRLSMALQGQRVSKTLEAEMLTTHKQCEQAYQSYKKLLLKRCEDQQLYDQAHAHVTKTLARWEKRSDLAQTMIRAVNKKPKKPEAKAEPKP